ncbi:MAG TPA: 2-oxoacid:acceptor oxidoreductase subunit alpha [Thermoanaerobaculia bacterium]|nr:2-oxoacid:acceptor oxidoreductase subunit alpha [Thermoanaerobaculia bacterium]
MSRELAVSIVGAGGDGAVAAGDILSMACARDGLHVIKTEAYGPQIRGGESSCTVRISSERIFAQADLVDALVVFSWADFARFRSEITPAPDAVIFHEEKDAPPADLSGCTLVPIPFTTLAREAGAPSGKNVLALGMISAALGLPADSVRSAVQHRFGKKTAAVVEANMKAFDRGAEIATTITAVTKKLTYTPGPARLLMSGNETSAVAAVDAGCRFFAGYPITPSSEILHFLGEWLPRIGGTCLQTEDELAAIGAVVGASFTGVKSMTATSGPGLSLMAEMIGLSSMSEVPSVIVNVQRGGPSTGIPTKSEQSDLLHTVFASHGDTPRAVIACSDVEDSYHATVDAFNIAEEFQLPVIVLSDQSIAQRRETLDESALAHEVRDRRLATPDELTDYLRYRVTADGVSPMSVPGMVGGMYQTNGLEHDEQGRPSSMFVTHEAMNAKRYRKLDAIAKRYPLFRRFGPADADLGILCWGSAAGPVREALEKLNTSGLRVAAFVPQMIMPLPKEALEQFVAGCRELLVVELSYSAQFYQYLRTQIDLPKSTHVFARSGGKSLGVHEIIEQVARALNHEVAVREVVS